MIFSSSDSRFWNSIASDIIKWKFVDESVS